jgi:hypothetical protein
VSEPVHPNLNAWSAGHVIARGRCIVDLLGHLVGWTEHPPVALRKMRAELGWPEQGVLDEMSVSALRAGFADAFFPSTSVLQTRVLPALRPVDVPWMVSRRRLVEFEDALALYRHALGQPDQEALCVRSSVGLPAWMKSMKEGSCGSSNGFATRPWICVLLRGTGGDVAVSRWDGARRRPRSRGGSSNRRSLQQQHARGGRCLGQRSRERAPGIGADERDEQDGSLALLEAPGAAR